MATKALNEAVEFAVIIARQAPNITSAEVQELLRLSRRHSRLQERACNEKTFPGYDAKCEASIKAICDKHGLKVEFGGDPRGFTVKIRLPGGQSNHWGGETWGVPQ